MTMNLTINDHKLENIANNTEVDISGILSFNAIEKKRCTCLIFAR